MTKINNPIRMTIEEANKKFHPYSYVMINAEFNKGYKAGIVVAYALMDEKDVLIDYLDELLMDKRNGKVISRDTKDPLDGGSLLGELRISD